MKYYILVVLAVFSAAGAQMLLKKGASLSYPTWIRQYLNLWVIGGYAIMGCSLMLNVYCLAQGVLVKEIGGIESLSYLFVPLLSRLFFKERITWRKAGAIAVIIIGVSVFFV